MEGEVEVVRDLLFVEEYLAALMHRAKRQQKSGKLAMEAEEVGLALMVVFALVLVLGMYLRQVLVLEIACPLGL